MSTAGEPRGVEGHVACPECSADLQFRLTGEAEIAKAPDKITIRYVPIVIEHVCRVNGHG